MVGDATRQAAFTRGTLLKDHKAYLQSLNREHKGMYLPLSLYEESVGAWNGTPVIFADDHPNMDVFEKDPELALGPVNGKFVGVVKDAHIENVGTPKLAATLELEDDAGLERLITPPPGTDAKVSISTGVWHGNPVKDPNLPVPVMTGPVRPQHVLLFMENLATHDVPGDGGAFILSKAAKEVDPTTDETDEASTFARFKTWLAKDKATTMQAPPEAVPANAPPAEEAPTPEPSSIEEAAEQASDAVVEAIGAASFDPEEGKKLAEALKTIETLRAKIAELEAGGEEEAATEKWENFKAHLPAGEMHGEKEGVWKKLWDEDPQAAALKALTLKVAPGLPGEDGQTFTAGGAGGEAESPTIGAFDPSTQTWGPAQRY